MRWEGNRESSNVEDARGGGGGRGGGFRVGGGSIGLGSVAIAVLAGGICTSAQRVTWFKRGLQTGSVAQCDTFQSREL